MTCPHADTARVLNGQPVCMLAASYARQLADAQAELAKVTAWLEVEIEHRKAMERRVHANTGRSQ